MISQKEIGSDIHIPFNLMLSSKKYKSIEGIFLSRGKDCIQQVINLERPFGRDTVLLPSYVCPSVIDQIKINNIVML